MSTTRWLAVVVATATLAACGGGATDEQPDAAVDGDRRVVALGEEFLLADLLALGIRPVASTATVAESGFQGIDPSLTEGIEALPGTEPNLERLAALRPDVVVTTPFVVDALGDDQLAGLAELVVVEATDPRDALVELASAFDADDRAEALLEDLDDAVAAARSELADAGPVTVATVYPGPSLAAWIDGPSTIPAVLLDAGVRLDPGPGSIPGAAGGRVYLDREQLERFAGEAIVLLQSDLVEGEQDALDSIEQDPIWQSLPAVLAGRVVVLDRLGYPGITGRVRAAGDLAEAVR